MRAEKRSLNVDTSNIYEWAGVEYVYQQPKDWSNLSFLYIWINGANTNRRWYLYVFSQSNGKLAWIQGIILDDYNGTRMYVIPLRQPITLSYSRSMNYSQIVQIRFITSGNTSSAIRLERFLIGQFK
jgi:hypothetical protein